MLEHLSCDEEAERRGDLEAKEIGIFVNLVLNGLALQRASGDEPPPPELVLTSDMSIEFVER